MDKRIAIILARGGSKRLPRKNVMNFGDKPMLAWTIEAALDSQYFDRVLVSTDSEEIAAIARQHGAEAPFLRHTAADDITPSSEATCIALTQAEQHWNERYELVAQLMANCPLRTANDIRAATDSFLNKTPTAPSQISSFKFGWMNPWWATKLQADGQPDFLFPEALKSRSQDLPALYCPTGAFWLSWRGGLLKHKTFYQPGHIFHPMDWVSAVDIDDEHDLLMARACLALRKESP